MLNIKIEKMKWDSEFFELEIYNGEKANQEIDLNVLLEGPFIVQTLVSEKDIEQITRLEDNNFKFVESKVTLFKKIVEKVVAFDQDNIRDVKAEDLLPYKDNFYDLYGNVTRYYMFGKEKINDFYYKWADKSTRGELDHKCIGHYTNNILEGFISYKIIDKSLTIGLVGVFPDFQGRRISQKLLDYINNIAVDNNCEKIYVATQGINTKAINAYITNGFFIDNIKHWYYFKGGLQ